MNDVDDIRYSHLPHQTPQKGLQVLSTETRITCPLQENTAQCDAKARACMNARVPVQVQSPKVGVGLAMWRGEGG